MTPHLLPPDEMAPAIGWKDGMEMLAWLQERQLMTTAQLGRAAFEWGMAFGEPHGHPPAAAAPAVEPPPAGIQRGWSGQVWADGEMLEETHPEPSGTPPVEAPSKEKDWLCACGWRERANQDPRHYEACPECGRCCSLVPAGKAPGSAEPAVCGECEGRGFSHTFAAPGTKRCLRCGGSGKDPEQYQEHGGTDPRGSGT